MSDENDSAKCACGTAPTLVFACSGAADVGKIADLAARELSSQGRAKMFCLAGIGGRVSGIMATTAAAAAILAVDGCPLDCAANCLKEAGFAGFEHLRLTDIGMEKGLTPPTDEMVAKAARNGAELLSKEM